MAEKKKALFICLGRIVSEIWCEWSDGDSQIYFFKSKNPTLYLNDLARRVSNFLSLSPNGICCSHSNICRSPIAEGVFQKVVNDSGQKEKWEIDSAAIGSWHVGNPPDWRALDTMKKHDVPYTNTARQISQEDFNHYDYIFGMDEQNMKDLNKRAPKNSKAKLLLLGDFDPSGDRIIRDPYYDSNSEGFEKCYQQALRGAKGFLDKNPA